MGILHRDLKPENILLDEFCNVKLSDFGWAAKIREGQERRTFCGTYEYMAPEIFEGDDYNHSVDVWALGILLYELLHGHSPYSSTSVFKVYKNIIKAPLKFAPHIDSKAADLITRILDIEPSNRLTIQQIKAHPFLNQIPSLSLENLNQRENVPSDNTNNFSVLSNLSESNNKPSPLPATKRVLKEPKKFSTPQTTRKTFTTSPFDEYEKPFVRRKNCIAVTWQLPAKKAPEKSEKSEKPLSVSKPVKAQPSVLARSEHQVAEFLKRAIVSKPSFKGTTLTARKQLSAKLSLTSIFCQGKYKTIEATPRDKFAFERKKTGEFKSGKTMVQQRLWSTQKSKISS